MQAFMPSINHGLSALPLFATAFLLAFAARWLFQKTTRFEIDEELTERDNTAFGIAFAGYMLGSLGKRGASRRDPHYRLVRHYRGCAHARKPMDQ